MVAVGQVRVVGGRFMVALAVMACGFAVVARSEFVVLGCLGVMMDCFVRHGEFLSTSKYAFGHGRNYGRREAPTGLQEREFGVNIWRAARNCGPGRS